MPGTFSSCAQAQRRRHFIGQIAALILASTTCLRAQQTPAQKPTNPSPTTKVVQEKRQPKACI